jgi:hypothetical protein
MSTWRAGSLILGLVYDDPMMGLFSAGDVNFYR